MTNQKNDERASVSVQFVVGRSVGALHVQTYAYERLAWNAGGTAGAGGDRIQQPVRTVTFSS
jgi:hypothetical protein